MEISSRLRKEIDKIANIKFGRTVSESIKTKICVQCSCNATSFRDELSVQEYQVSGLCQGCQDPIFGLGDSEIDDM